MYIKQAKIDNFGKLHEKTFQFVPGLNVVYGENESGKSTLMSFLKGMLFGMEKQRGKTHNQGDYEKYEPWNANSYYTGGLVFDVAGRDFALERNFYHKEKGAVLYNRQDGEELSVDRGDLEILLGGATGIFYENTFCIPQASVVTEVDFAEKLQQEMINVLYGGDGNIHISEALKILETAGKGEEQKLKKYRKQKQEHLDRLEWERDLLEGDIRELEQKILVLPIQKEPMPKTEKKIFRLWIIGPVLRFFGRIFGKITKRKVQREAALFSTWEILKEQLEEKQIRFTNVMEEIEESQILTRDEMEMQRELDSIRLAQEAIQEAAKEGYQDGKDQIEAAVSEVFSGITGGKYDRVELGQGGKVYLYSREKQLEPWQMSRGTLEQLYLALRLGVGRCILREEKLPILLDETFCAYDGQRLQQTLQWLSKQDNQIIIFTCQKRELYWLKELGIEHNRIIL